MRNSVCAAAPSLSLPRKPGRGRCGAAAAKSKVCINSRESGDQNLAPFRVKSTGFDNWRVVAQRPVRTIIRCHPAAPQSAS
jgi:hypothetical protein